MYDKYLKLLYGALDDVVCGLTLKGYDDNYIIIQIAVRWRYLFPDLTYFDWSQILAEYRRQQLEKGSV